MIALRRPSREIRGTVRSESGEPVAGALVMGLDLGYTETADDGTFTLFNPEMALSCWCLGFHPSTQLLCAATNEVNLTLQPLKMKRAAAAGG